MEPSKNYQLFLKATQIETVVQTLSACGMMYSAQKTEMNCLKQVCGQFREFKYIFILFLYTQRNK